MKKIKSFIRPIHSSLRMHATCGWGNGYAVIPPGHPMYGKDYDDIPVDIHGGLTFGKYAKELDWVEIPEGSNDCFIVGFDCAHYMDTMETCPESYVKAEAENLARQLEKLAK